MTSSALHGIELLLAAEAVLPNRYQLQIASRPVDGTIATTSPSRLRAIGFGVGHAADRRLGAANKGTSRSTGLRVDDAWIGITFDHERF
jgi:hypothetical protein